MALNRTIAVIGATGTVGSATVKTLSANYADQLKIVAGVRDPGKAQSLSSLPGVSVVEANMNKSDELAITLKNVDYAFIVTPSTEDRALLVEAATEAARKAGVKFALVVSVTTADLSDTIFGKQFSLLEGSVSKVGIAHCFLRLPMFIDNNAVVNREGIREKGLYIGPLDPDKYCTTATVANIAEAAAAILADPLKHYGKTYNLVSNHYTHNQLASYFAEALDKEVKYFRMSYEDAMKGFAQFGFPEWQANGILELFRLIDAGSPATNVADRNDYERITGQKPTSAKEWVQQNVGVFQ
ncbi:NAD(P)H azoreductase-like [Oscarella lobularis]|uniref:NAD(P)H azoreductase-like n=1 Tax=Oscarella lobularis TaxID=121494 RepID=UPI0033141588